MNNNKNIFWCTFFAALLCTSEMSFLYGAENGDKKTNLFSVRSRTFSRESLVRENTKYSEIVKNDYPSKAKAFLLSFILPGAGEYYAGSNRMARIFLGTEVFLWTTYFSLRTYGNWKKDDYKLFAVSHAGVDLTGKDDKYFVNIENYDNITDYNEAKLRQRNVDALYQEDGTWNWQWDSKRSRLEYEKLRISSDKAYSRSLFVIGGILVNHLVSGIDAIRIARKKQKLNEKRVRFGVIGLPERGVMITMWKCF